MALVNRSGKGFVKICRFAVVLFVLAMAALRLHAQLPDTLHTGSVRLLFIGDMMGHDTQIAAAYDPKTGEYDYNEVFRYISPIISDADIAIANLEVTLAGAPYRGYPRFSSPAAFAAAASEAGIDIMVTANNHAIDRGLPGIDSTLFRLDSMGIASTGTYRNAAERKLRVPLMIERNGIRLALLNYTYGTNGIQLPQPAVVDLIDRNTISSDIQAARVKQADGIIVFIHWGTEYDTLPGKEQKDIAGWLAEQGVDLIIGSHSHVIQPMLLEEDETSGDRRLIVWSLGNFVSNQRNRRTDGGAMVAVTVSKKDGHLMIDEAGYILTWVYTPVEEGLKRFYVLAAARHENDNPVPGDIESKRAMSLFLNDSRRLLNCNNKGVKEIR
jgi:poly-gamma-glutamate synthesis protein (capsule biosynthesis protein)